MSPRTGRFLLALGLLAAAALVYWALEDGGGDEGFDLDRDELPREADAAAPVGTPGRAPDTQPPKKAPAAVAPQGDLVPRVLPPDAAIEDVRDALTLTGSKRTREVQAAYSAIARIADDAPGVRQGLQRYLARVESPVARGIVLAGLGSDRAPANITWLTQRLLAAKTTPERIGALHGLAFGASEYTQTATTLAGIKMPAGSLPTGRDTRTAVAAFLDTKLGPALVDAQAVVLLNVSDHVDYAALLVVGGTRTCAFFDAAPAKVRDLLRRGALRHAALPGAVRRVLEAAK